MLWRWLCDGNSATIWRAVAIHLSMEQRCNHSIHQHRPGHLHRDIDRCPADTDWIQINIAPQPNPQIVGSLTVCELTTATYTASNATAVSYLWSVVGGTLISPNNNNPVTVSWSNGSGGSISLTAANALCDTT